MTPLRRHPGAGSGDARRNIALNSLGGEHHHPMRGSLERFDASSVEHGRTFRSFPPNAIHHAFRRVRDQSLADAQQLQHRAFGNHIQGGNVAVCEQAIIQSEIRRRNSIHRERTRRCTPWTLLTRRVLGRFFVLAALRAVFAAAGRDGSIHRQRCTSRRRELSLLGAALPALNAGHERRGQPRRRTPTQARQFQPIAHGPLQLNIRNLQLQSRLARCRQTVNRRFRASAPFGSDSTGGHLPNQWDGRQNASSESGRADWQG